MATTQVALDRLIRRIAKARNVPLSRISVCYEAGGCGMWIARILFRCWQNREPYSKRQ